MRDLSRRTLLRLCCFAAVPLATPLAHAQAVSLYATYAPTHFSNVDNPVILYLPAGSGPVTLPALSFWTSGVTGGASLGIVPIGPIHLQSDFRVSGRAGNQGYLLLLTGVKAGLHLPHVRIHPYVEAAGGYLQVRGSQQNFTSTTNAGAYEILGGVDYPILPLFDLRLIEVGGGQSFAFSGGNGYNPSLFTLNTGLVFHF